VKGWEQLTFSQMTFDQLTFYQMTWHHYNHRHRCLLIFIRVIFLHIRLKHDIKKRTLLRMVTFARIMAHLDVSPVSP
jgi:hypothetical protein